jgi:signal transduction histidine kinase
MSRMAVRPPRVVVLLVAAVTVVPLLALLWLGWRLVEQDRALQRQQVQQRVERAADLIAASLKQTVTGLEARLTAGDGSWPEGSVVLTVRDDRLDIVPAGRIAYWPTAPRLPEAPAAAFAAADALEFRGTDLGAAIQALSALSASSDPAVRAGALVRLGRCLRKAGRVDEALAAYARMSDLDAVAIDAVPAGLAAAYARATLLEQLNRPSELRDEATSLEQALRTGRWKLTAPIYTLYASDLSRWVGADPAARRPGEQLAASVSAVWDQWPSRTDAGRQPSMVDFIEVNGETATVLWRSVDSGMRALVASSHFIQSQVLTEATTIAAGQQVSFVLRNILGKDAFGQLDATATPRAVRLAADAGLPWTVVVATMEPPPEAGGFALRRRWLIGGFSLMALVALTAGFFSVRAVTHELAVARQQSDFVAAVSHEFRTPLTALRQFTDMLREQPSLDDSRRRVAYDAQARATDRLTRLVESLLDFGRMEAGVRSYDPQPTDAASLIRQTVDDFCSGPEASHDQITCRSDDAGQFDVDREAVARAVRNLLENAVKYSPAEAPVEVGVARRNGHVLVSVRDHGIGIPRPEQSLIFAKFQRGEEARVRGIKGTGIGLAMVDEIVKAHGGRVDLESRPGEGSTFTIVLPALEALNPELAPSTQHPQPST